MAKLKGQKARLKWVGMKLRCWILLNSQGALEVFSMSILAKNM